MHKILISLIILCYFASCNRKPSQQTDPGLSNQAKQILGKVDTMRRYKMSDQAINYLDSTYHTIKNPSVKDLFERLNVKFMHYRTTKEDAAKTNLYADSMLALLNNWQNQYKLEYIDALFAKGDATLMNKQSNTAFHYYYKAQYFAAKNLDKCHAYGFTYRLGEVRYKQKQYQQAIHFFKQAYHDSEKCNDKQTLYNTYLSKNNYLNSIGICYELIGKLDSATLYYKKAVNLINQYPQMHQLKEDYILTSMGIVYGNLGGVYAKLGQYDQAEYYLKKSIAINDRPEFDEVDALTAKIKLAKLYLNFNHLQKTDRVLKGLRRKLAVKYSEKAMPIETQLKLYQLEWMYYDKTGNIPKAYANLQLYYNKQDSFNKASLALKASDIDMFFKNNEQQYKLNSLSEEKEKQQNYLLSLIVFSVVIIITLFFLSHSRKKLKMLNRQTTEQNIQMQKLLKALELSQYENTRMMQIVAHDLRSPLAAAISITSLLKDADLTTDEHKMVDLLETSCTHSLEMIADLLNINTNANDIKTESVVLKSLIMYCIELLQFKAKAKEQNLIFSGINVTIKANPAKIWRLVSNLIVNAIKFSPIGGNIEIEMFKTQDKVTIKIKDQGIGIPIEHRDKIFDIFTDARRVGTSGEHSFGIGLATSKQIVEAHHGDIWFESKINEGSTFYISLPL
ncbi:ATP-binding protein [Pedobacter sp. N23S346]|uniref:tetratricopeptide repeat-containing sensor histidine kinase n=1 Tax=Pedobacter sp. N23S346 TaxID=3402750 RepID=UPI003AD582D6